LTDRGPDQVLAGFGEALRARDAEGASARLTRGACFVTPDSTVIHGRAEVLEFLQQFVRMIDDLIIHQRTIVNAGEVALGSEAWSMRLGGGALGTLRDSRATIVLTRVERTWKIAVVDPWRQRI
jgi:ketosteroid isomerase-like protein